MAGDLISSVVRLTLITSVLCYIFRKSFRNNDKCPFLVSGSWIEPRSAAAAGTAGDACGPAAAQTAARAQLFVSLPFPTRCS